VEILVVVEMWAVKGRIRDPAAVTVTVPKATRYAARTDIVSVPLTSLVDQVAAGPQVVAMVVVEIMAEETLEVHQVTPAR